MKKHAYLRPQTTIVAAATTSLVCNSPMQVTGLENGPDYGGIDDGSHDPASRRRHCPQSVWDDEEDESSVEL